MNGAEIKKHVGAVHVRGSLSLLERKVSNVLLYNAAEELEDFSVAEHTIRLPILAEIVGFDSKDFRLVKDALRALVDYKVEWNVLGEKDGQEEWGVSSFLASARVERHTGICTYSYSAPLRKRLANPAIYARINLAVQTRFASAYALALYENCVRFRKVGSTGFIALETWRGLLGVEDGEYEEYKYLNKRVFRPAVDGVNAHSDIRVVMETKKENRRVVAVKFRIHEAPPGAAVSADEVDGVVAALVGRVLPDARTLAPEPAEVIEEHPLASLQQRLLTFGLTEAQALDLSTEFPETRVASNLDHVEAEVARGLDPDGREVKNVAAFTVAAVRGDYAASARTPDVVRQASEKKREAALAAKQKQEQTVARKESAAEAKEAAKAREQQALANAWAALSGSEREGFTKRAVARMRSEAPQAYQWYEEERAAGRASGEMRPAVRSTLRSFQYEEMGRLL